MQDKLRNENSGLTVLFVFAIDVLKLFLVTVVIDLDLDERM